MASFFEHIQFQARSRPKAPAIMSARNVINYEELVDRSRVAMRYLTEQNIMSGETIVLNIQDPISHCCAIIASMSLGIANLSAIGMRLQLPRNLPISAILTDQEPQKIEAPEDGNVRIIGVSATWLKEGLGIRETPRIREDNDRVARIICTSGTTGEQKAVPFSEGQLIQRAWGAGRWPSSACRAEQDPRHDGAVERGWVHQYDARIDDWWDFGARS